jgi:hypothetical protein
MKGSVRLTNNVPMTALLLHAVAQWANYRRQADNRILLRLLASLLQSTTNLWIVLKNSIFLRNLNN